MELLFYLFPVEVRLKALKLELKPLSDPALTISMGY